MPAYWSLLSVTGPQFYRADSNTPRSVYFKIRQIAAVLEWRLHQQALGSAWQALEPYHNLRVGAAILRRCHATVSDWWDSLGCYHAPNNPVRAQQYRDRVTGYWRQVTQEHESK